MLKFNASMPRNSCIALHNDLDLARNEINELKLTHTTCVDELEHAKAKFFEMKSMPCSMCYFILDDDVCLTSCDIHDTLPDVNVDDCSCGLICTSCIELKNEVLALKRMRDGMSAKLVEHNEMSGNLEHNLENALCGTCDCVKHENEILVTRCRSLCAKSLDSHDSCHSDVGVSKIASSQPELASSVERESLIVGTCATALDSSSIAIPKLVASSGIAQDNSLGKGASHFFGTHTSKPKFHCTFCKKDGHTVEFCFRRVKHERHVRAKAFRKSRSISHGTYGSNLSTKLDVDASCSKSQRTSHLNENGNLYSRIVPPNRPLYRCSFCEKDGHQESFCYCRARRMR
ncbi:hypothetical protein PVAP13_8KG327908 [Panicum virgatum]|uniref:Uncharacterized protein n=1 Tax=Panicum virgatum TaxID=38727 RepID=A0A8T0PPH5_PANVG|nr:hypothetical protein PVAP13_8KG327908 [Panicum virgatum]